MSFTVTTTTGHPYAHPAGCSGCPVCREEFAKLLTMPASEHAAWLQRRNNEHPNYHRFAANAPDDPPTLESVFKNHFVRSGPPAPSASEVLLPSDNGYADAPPSIADVINDQIQKGVREP